ALGARLAAAVRWLSNHAHVAQLDNVPDHESGRWRFDSSRAHHIKLLQYAIFMLLYASLHATRDLPALKGSVTSLRTKGLRPQRGPPLARHRSRSRRCRARLLRHPSERCWFDSNSGETPIAQR